MISFYKTIDNKLEKIDNLCHGCWINVVNPTQNEIDFLENLGVDSGFIRSSLDEEEMSRVEAEDGQTLIIVDTPVACLLYDDDNTSSDNPKGKKRKKDPLQKQGAINYYTAPIGIIIMENCLITISINENPILTEFEYGMIRGVNTSFKTRFLLTILLRIASRFLQHLKQIDKTSNYMERELHISMKNKELIQLLTLEKSLVYFNTSLKANESTIKKISRGKLIKLYEEDEELLDDVLIEIHQAIEMASIYSDVLSGTMDAFASIISNNLNIVMKVLTSITIVMAIPTIVSSFYGMNVEWIPLPYFWFPIAVSIVAMLVVGGILLFKKMF